MGTIPRSCSGYNNAGLLRKSFGFSPVIRSDDTDLGLEINHDDGMKKILGSLSYLLNGTICFPLTSNNSTEGEGRTIKIARKSIFGNQIRR